MAVPAKFNGTSSKKRVYRVGRSNAVFARLIPEEPRTFSSSPLVLHTLTSAMPCQSLGRASGKSGVPRRLAGALEATLSFQILRSPETKAKSG
jgi:hypothetical protein